MFTLSTSILIANAAARLNGPRGAVTRQAQDAGCSRQTVYIHADKVKAAVEAECGAGETREALIERLDSLLQENAQLWEWLDGTVEFPTAKRQEFAVTAMAMGLSNSQIRELMVILLGAKASPGRSTIHRWIQVAGTASTRVLEQLDRRCRESVLTGCLDEIFFHGRPVLVGVEPHSMVWFLGKKAENRQASTWFTELQPWDSLGYVTSDAGSGLQGGLAQLQEHQRATGQVPVEKGLDVFHPKQAAQQALRVNWTRVERAWHQAEAADRALKRARWEGRSERKLARQRDEAWSKAVAAFKSYEKIEAVWKRVATALDLFRPDGQLNDRAWAQEQVAWGLPRLKGSDWSKVRGYLQNKEAFTFLDRLHNQLNQLSLSPLLRDALVHLWWLRRQLPKKSVETAPAGYSHAAYLVQQVLCAKLDPNWRESYRQVAAVLRRTVRASSVVECMNSVLRMHQARHRTVTQPMLDLKRLYWNTRVFRAGKRKGQCPYEHLGLKLQSYDFWTLLQAADDEESAQAKVDDSENQARAA